MAELKKSVFVDAPVEEVFGYLRDPMSNVEWLPSMEEIKEVRGEGVGARFRWVYRMAGIALEGESTATEFVPNERFTTQSSGGVESTWYWTFAPEGGGTRINVVIEYKVPIPVLGRLAEALVVKQNDRELDTAMANIKARVEGSD
jgi:uncharacterized membrane protein